MAALKFQLAEEPEIGAYRIDLETDGRTEQKRFTVDEYGRFSCGINICRLVK